MKGKYLTLFTNFILAAVIVAVSFVGFFGTSATAVSYENDILFYSGDKSENGISLTFNVYEGTDIVLQILDVLDEYGAKATFFIGGCWADDNIDCVREICNRGHEIGSHGYFHKDHSKLNVEGNLEEIRPSIKLLEMICGQKISLFAPPSGAFSENTISACENLGLKVIMWSRDTIDWRDKDVNLVAQRATDNLKAGEIILMHPKSHTLNALPQILTYIRNNGLSAVKITDNIGE